MNDTHLIIQLGVVLHQMEKAGHRSVDPVAICSETPYCHGVECHECPFNSRQDWQRFTEKLEQEQANG